MSDFSFQISKMSKNSKYKNIGSRGGNGYWTLYRISRKKVSTSRNPETDQTECLPIDGSPSIEENAFDKSVPIEETDIGNLNPTQQDSSDESLVNDYCDSPIRSSEEESFLECQTEPETSEMDINATEIFRNLALRHPDLSNLFLKDMLDCLRKVGLNVPKDARTLLQAPKQPIPMRTVYPGVYWHYGFDC